MMSLAVMVFKGQGAAYRAVHLAGLEKNLEVLELIPLGDETQVLVKGPVSELQNWMIHPEQKPISKTLIEKWNARIERAFYSLESASPEKALLIVEGNSLGSLFLSASRAIEAGLQIVDLKIPRGSVKWGNLILTSSEVTPSALQAVSIEGLEVTQIPQASPALRRYFEIEP